MPPHIYFVEGNIGSGKTHFLKMIERCYHDKYQVIKEQVHWKNHNDKDGKNITTLIKEDHKKYAHTCQVMSIIGRMEMLEKIDMTKECVFIDQSIWSDRFVFSKLWYDLGMIGDIDYQLYVRYFEWFARNSVPPHTFIYFKCPVEVLLASEHNTISEDYLQHIESNYQEMFNSMRTTDSIITIESYDVNTFEDFEEMIKEIFFEEDFYYDV